MASRVYFASTRARGPKENKSEKLKALFDAAGFGEFIDENALTAVKLHFGEPGCDTFVNPVLVARVVDKIKDAGGKPFLCDTNTLYAGGRRNAVDHAVTAIKNGFSYATVGAPVIITDGLKGLSHVHLEMNLKHTKKAWISQGIVEADAMIAVSHFKGHMMAGFGGAIKNLSMGCASPAGKLEQHCGVPKVDEEKCIACGLCIEHCPTGALAMNDDTGKAFLDQKICIGCAECMTVCKSRAFTFDWAAEIPVFTEKLVEYAYAAIKHKQKKCGFINFVLDVTPDCDCASWSDAAVVPDIGILASTDPVAIDKASYDLVNKAAAMPGTYIEKNLEPGENKFKGMWAETQCEIQFEYGQEIGLGSADYELEEV